MFTSTPVEIANSNEISQQHIFVRKKHFPGAPTQNEHCTLKEKNEFFVCKLVLLLLVAATLRLLVPATLRLLVAAILRLIVCCNLAACAFFVCKLDFSLLVAACLLQTVAACLLQTAVACLRQTAASCN